MSLVRIWRERSSHDEVFYNFLQLNRIRYKLFDSFEMQVWNQFLTPDVAVATTLKYLMRNYDISFLCDALISGQTQLDLRKGIQRALLDLWQEQKMDLRTAISKLKLDGFTKNNEAFEVRVQMLEMHVLLVKWNENWNKEEKAWLEKTWTAFKRMRKDSEKNNDLLQWKPLMELLENPPSDLQRSNTILKLETN
ncbi:hypothetical protein CCR75_002508 [Bremia lactucae]|uniref:Uncharacterized protein n=1 Tax=Bremia lactucae TaxID=4779 RepID=A0A976II59_BRELC|nr:hypothetical protein CCR75_002508 [Bremia lactucae]